MLVLRDGVAARLSAGCADVPAAWEALRGGMRTAQLMGACMKNEK